jgi:hypothetical protein
MTDLSVRSLSDSVRQERVDAIAAFGFTERQARFLVYVLVHSGVFLERQYRSFAGIAHGQKTHDFLRKLVGRGYATAITPGALHRGRLFHVQYKPLYQAIGEPDNRNRKPASLGRFVERLMLLDAVLADPRFTWLGTERDKLAYFILCSVREGMRKDEYPHITFGEIKDQTVRYFPDKLPIGVEVNGGRRHVFVYLITRATPTDFRLFLHRHGELLRTVPEWTIRILVPRAFRKAVALYRYAIRDELATPLRPSTLEELEWLFRVQAKAKAGPSPDPTLSQAAMEKKYRSARFRALRRIWEREGHAALRATLSHTLRDRLEIGRGRIEFVALSHQYLQLASLVGVA